MNINRSGLGPSSALDVRHQRAAFGAGTVRSGRLEHGVSDHRSRRRGIPGVGGGTRVTVGISGTGGGFKRFCRGETDISDASRPILKEEMVRARRPA